MVANNPIIREIKIEDVEDFLNLRRQLDQETKFMLLEPGERKVRPSEMKKQVDGVLSCDNQTIFVIEDNDSLVGFLSAIGGKFKRNAKTVYVVVGILEKYTGNGLGTALFQELENWARSIHIHRLELTVMTHNMRGIALYRKMGFAIEGVRKHSLLVEDRYVNEYVMGKVFT